ncbi:hypothetical protein A7X88_08155 [Stenotrophomonas maltophilia]|nr:hypothetical protein [Stenotrophomonas maltophilia]PZT27071.1 hypothetical protein A7X88_08155 [Stenotrophomonas maltophilia]
MVSVGLRAVEILEIHAIHLHFSQVGALVRAVTGPLRRQHLMRARAFEAKNAAFRGPALRNQTLETVAFIHDAVIVAKRH